MTYIPEITKNFITFKGIFLVLKCIINLSIILFIFPSFTPKLKVKGTRPLSRCYDDKIKLNLLKNTAGPHLDHSKMSLIRETPI